MEVIVDSPVENIFIAEISWLENHPAIKDVFRIFRFEFLSAVKTIYSLKIFSS